MAFWFKLLVSMKINLMFQVAIFGSYYPFSNPLKIWNHLQPIEIQVNKKMKLKKKFNKIS